MADTTNHILAKKPSELFNGEWIKITQHEHPDTWIDGKPSGDPGHAAIPTGAIKFFCDYSQVTMTAIDKNQEPGGEGTIIAYDDSRELMDRIFDNHMNLGESVIESGSLWGFGPN
jgi:hypothetical protein